MLVPRIALFADTFHEVNGAANVLRRLVSYAETQNYPLLCIRSGQETKFFQDKSISVLELKRSRLAITMDGELKYDPLMWRYKSLVDKTLARFSPDIIHVTGLNDVSQIGFFHAHFNKTKAVASWHTNMHEYAAHRLCQTLRWMPSRTRTKISNFVEQNVFRGVMKLHFLAQAQLAPNEELVAQIRRCTRRPSFLMSRGVDIEFFHPSKRQRQTDDTFTLGFVGRLRPEKNVHFLAEIGKALIKQGITNFKFLIVGEGSEAAWLRTHVPHAHLTGVLRGEQLAEAYANMDLFVFPSRTDAFGNVVLEAMAAGVPAVVMPDGGPKFLIENKLNGFIADSDDNFVEIIKRAIENRAQIVEMSRAAREAACQRSWNCIFEQLYDVYRQSLQFSKGVRVEENVLLSLETTS